MDHGCHTQPASCTTIGASEHCFSSGIPKIGNFEKKKQIYFMFGTLARKAITSNLLIRNIHSVYSFIAYLWNLATRGMIEQNNITNVQKFKLGRSLNVKEKIT